MPQIVVDKASAAIDGKDGQDGEDEGANELAEYKANIFNIDDGVLEFWARA